MIIHDIICGIKTLVLSNEKISVTILVDKGGDISQITYLPEKVDFLHVEKKNFSCYENRDLHICRLEKYSQDSTGGWQDVVPGYGRYGNTVLKDYPVGIAATVPWKVVEETKEKPVSVLLETHLPLFPLLMKKRIRLEDETVFIEESIHNEGKENAEFTWTQHSVFGGNFLDENVEILYPGEEIFLSSLYAKEGRNKEAFYENIHAVTMPDGSVRDLARMRKRENDGQLIFTMKAKEGCFELFHRNKKLGMRVNWNLFFFPYIRCWYQNSDSGYSYALEPCNYSYSSFEDTDREKMYLCLSPGEEKSTVLQVKILHGK